MNFDFSTPSRILFGPGRVCEIAPAAKQFGRRVLLVTGKSAERWAFLEQAIRREGMDCFPFRIGSEPTLDVVREGVELAAGEGCDVVIGAGGGSAIDAAKAIAVLVANDHDPLEYLEIIGKGRPIENPGVPFIAVPSTAGTGAEVTRNSVLASPQQRVKASLRSPFLLARLAIVDPDLTLGLPSDVTAYSGLDALTQLIEAYVSIRANPVTDGFCLEGLSKAAASLVRCYHHPDDREARTNMAAASLLSGMALANAGLGAVHGFASPIGGSFFAPHGAVCAALLSHATRINVHALQTRAPESNYLHRYRISAQILTGNPQAGEDDISKWLVETCHALNVPRLRSYGIKDMDFPNLIESAKRASSMKGNPIMLTNEELSQILAAAL